MRSLPLGVRVSAGEPIAETVRWVYDRREGIPDLVAYHPRHSTPSLLILTVHERGEYARRVADSLEACLRDQIVVEIGAGVGLLAPESAACTLLDLDHCSEISAERTKRCPFPKRARYIH